jgi:hypothetical protein
MLHRSVFDGAISAERMRRLIRKRGYVLGHPVWTSQEDEIVRACYPDYALAAKKLPHRSYNALRGRTHALGIQKKRHIWTGKELTTLRQMSPHATGRELLAAFPFASLLQIRAIRKHYKIPKPQARLNRTRFPIINEIRARSVELGLSMGELDSIAGTGTYFQKAQWHTTKGTRPHLKHVYAAIEALGGNLSVVWHDE